MLLGGAVVGPRSDVAIPSSRFCTVNVTMMKGSVCRMNFVGPTGGLLTQGGQWAFAVQNSLK